MSLRRKWVRETITARDPNPVAWGKQRGRAKKGIRRSLHPRRKEKGILLRKKKKRLKSHPKNEIAPQIIRVQTRSLAGQQEGSGGGGPFRVEHRVGLGPRGGTEWDQRACKKKARGEITPGRPSRLVEGRGGGKAE